MKFSYPLLLFLCLFAGTLRAQVSSSDELVQKIFASLQAKDEGAFLSLHPDSVKLVRMMKKNAKDEFADFKSDITKDVPCSDLPLLAKSFKLGWASIKKQFAPGEIRRVRQDFRASFKSIIEDGEKAGINWASATFTKFEFDTARPAYNLFNYSLARYSNFKPVRGKIYFNDRDSAGQIWLGNLLFIPEENKWYAGIQEAAVIVGNEADLIEVRDVVVQNISEEAPPPPPLLPSKKKRKSSAGKKKLLPKS